MIRDEIIIICYRFYALNKCLAKFLDYPISYQQFSPDSPDVQTAGPTWNAEIQPPGLFDSVTSERQKHALIKPKEK